MFVLGACGGSTEGNTPDAPAPPRDAAGDAAADAPAGDGPAGCGAEIAFDMATGCVNDGSVEFCIPDGDVELRERLANISSAITCAPGGGRAMCLNPPGRLLCFYPTEVPAECVADNGAMTGAAWEDMCSISALPEVTAIVPTIFE